MCSAVCVCMHEGTREKRKNEFDVDESATEIESGEEESYNNSTILFEKD